MKRLVISGYKQHELGIFDDKHLGIKYIKKALKKELIPLIEEGLEWVLLSGQLGVEAWAAEVVQELRENYPQLKYTILTPFLDQEKNWNEANQEKYHSIVSQADFHQSITNKPYEGPWQFVEKNKFLIRNSDGILLLYDEEKEGSPRYLKDLADQYAQHHKYEIRTITMLDLQYLIEEDQWENE